MSEKKKPQNIFWQRVLFQRFSKDNYQGDRIQKREERGFSSLEGFRNEALMRSKLDISLNFSSEDSLFVV